MIAMNLDEIRELIKLAAETKVAELEVQRGEDRVRIRLTPPPDNFNQAPIYHPVQMAMPAGMHGAQPSVAETGAGTPYASSRMAEKPTGPPNDGTVLVKSPIVGTFYESSAPGVAPFVRVGESVQPGKVLCIIESMK